MITRWKLVRAALDATSKLLHAHALTDGDEGDDAQTAAEPNATFLQQLGVAARPLVNRTLRALGVEHGDEVLLLKVWDKARLPAALDEGETQAFACGDVAVRLRLRTTGVVLEAKGATVTITSTGAVTVVAATGQRVDLQAGTQAFVRGDDYYAALNAHLGALDALLTALTTVFTALNTYALGIQPTVDPTPPGVGTLTPPLSQVLTTSWSNATTAYTTAAATFRAARLVYLSTKVKGE